MRHINFFPGGAKMGGFGGGQQVYVEKVDVLFPSPNNLLRFYCQGFVWELTRERMWGGPVKFLDAQKVPAMEGVRMT